MSESANLLETWRMGRAVLKAFVLSKLTPEVISNRVHPDSNSVGFLLRHIAEADYSMAATFLNSTEMIDKQTLGPGITDNGSLTDMQELVTLLEQSAQVVARAIENTTDWD